MPKYYTVLIHQEGGEWLVRVPDVPGCVTGGATFEEACLMARDALCGCLCVYEDENIALPERRMPQDIALEPGEIAALLEIDLLKYRENTDTRAVRKNVSMPAWMATLADRRGINCSQVLQEALRQRFSDLA